MTPFNPKKETTMTAIVTTERLTELQTKLEAAQQVVDAEEAFSALSAPNRTARNLRRQLQDETALKAKQEATVAAHQVAEKAAAKRLAAMTAELERSRERLCQACLHGAIADVDEAAGDHDALVRGFATELRSLGLLLEEEGVTFTTGGDPHGPNVVLEIAGTTWCSVDRSQVVARTMYGSLRSLYGETNGSWSASIRRQFNLDALDSRVDNLFAAAPLPPARQLKAAPSCDRPSIDEPLIWGDPAAAAAATAAEVEQRRLSFFRR